MNKSAKLSSAKGLLQTAHLGLRLIAARTLSRLLPFVVGIIWLAALFVATLPLL